MRKILCVAVLIMVAVAGTQGCSPHKSEIVGGFTDEQIHADSTVYIDFSDIQGLPLFKKIAMFSIGWVDASRMIRTLDALEALRPGTVRIDMGMGYAGMGAAVGLGNEKSYASNYSALINYSRLLQKHEVQPYWCYYSLPKAAQDTSSKDPVHDGLGSAAVWEDICSGIAAEFLKNGIHLYGHEIGNEPDYKEFFIGSWQQYLDIYRYGVAGIRKSDPDAVVGGLSLAYPAESVGRGYVDDFLKFCTETATPVDFVSYHSYNNEEILRATEAMRTVLSEYPEYNHVRFHVTEYNTGFDAKASQGYASAARFFNIAEKLNAITDLEVVNWACFLSPYDYLGALSLNGDYPYAIYHAIKFFNHMPYQQAGITRSTSHVKAIASSEEGRACSVIYNPTEKPETVTVLFDKLPFDKGTVTEHLIDKSHSSYFDNKDGKGKLHTVKSETADLSAGVKWSGTVDANSCVLIEFKAPDAASELDERPQIGDFVRRDFYFSDRGKNLYAYTDLLNYVTFMGMNGSSRGEVSTSLTFDDAADIISVDIHRYADCAAASQEAYCGVRVDFEGKNGYVKSAYYSLGDFSGNTAASPVSTNPADIAKTVKDDFVIDVKGLAPEDFTGRVVITFAIKDCQPDAMVKLCLKEG